MFSVVDWGIWGTEVSLKIGMLVSFAQLFSAWFACLKKWFNNYLKFRFLGPLSPLCLWRWCLRTLHKFPIFENYGQLQACLITMNSAFPSSSWNCYSFNLFCRFLFVAPSHSRAHSAAMWWTQMTQRHGLGPTKASLGLEMTIVHWRVIKRAYPRLGLELMMRNL